jgi:hypothetical protein
MMSNLELFRQAIRTRSRIEATSGDGLQRVLCPYYLGYNKSGAARVLAYQVGGRSKSGLGGLGSQENWRCLAVDLMRQVRLVDGPWYDAPRRRGVPTCLATIVEQAL